MSAEQAIRDGDLSGALAELQAQVRNDPANAKHRIFLFQLLSVQGDWDRAARQLNLLGDLDAATLAMVQTYREALRCEKLRAGVFEGKHTPLVFGDPTQWVALMIEALRVAGQGDQAGAQRLRGEAFELAPTVQGKINDDAFEWVADADSRLGPMTEAIINGAYYWVPFERIKELQIEPPADLRDVVWMPAQFTWANGGGTVALIPTRYPGSESDERAQIRLARRTEWLEQGEDVYVGLGQRMLATDQGEYPLMDVRTISLDVPDQGSEEESAGDALEPATEQADG